MKFDGNPDQFRSVPGLRWMWESAIRKLLDAPPTARIDIVRESIRFNSGRLKRNAMAAVALLLIPLLAHKLLGPIFAAAPPGWVFKYFVDMLMLLTMWVCIPMGILGLVLVGLQCEAQRIDRWLLRVGLDAMAVHDATPASGKESEYDR